MFIKKSDVRHAVCNAIYNSDCRVAVSTVDAVMQSVGAESKYKYKDNAAYEISKSKLFNALAHNNSVDPGNVGIYALLNNLQFAENLLKQSVWAGAAKPIPVVRDGNGKNVKRYTWLDWIAKLNEELDEVKYAVSQYEDRFGDADYDEEDGARYVAEELQDLITVCTSMQKQFLGFDNIERDKICAEVNEKNEKRGYFSKG